VNDVKDRTINPFNNRLTLNDLTVSGSSAGTVFLTDITCSIFLITDAPKTIAIPRRSSVVSTNFDANGSAGNLITLMTTGSWSSTGDNSYIFADNTSISYVTVSKNTAMGAAIPFDATNNCVDGGNNINWEFETSPHESWYW
ncbi:hypothetical protein KKH23_07705, partial [Patescibacteria group bacterium]|nr:hypothetical protein [Patescibacteria group bacterium]